MGSAVRHCVLYPFHSMFRISKVDQPGWYESAASRLSALPPDLATMSGTLLTHQRLVSCTRFQPLVRPAPRPSSPPARPWRRGTNAPRLAPPKEKAGFGRPKSMLFKHVNATPSDRDNQSASRRRPSLGGTPFRAPLRRGSMAAASISSPGIGPTIAVPRRYPSKP
jgi:hypothetical protein